MKRKVVIIGIGAGNPDFVTVQAINAMNAVDVFFIPDKGADKEELARTRREIIDRFVQGNGFRIVDYDTPTRRPAGDDDDYQQAVSDWHGAIEETYGELLMQKLGDGELGAFLVWGDPTLYDSVMRILERLQARGSFELEYEVIPGISSIQALAARHKVALCDIGRSVLITTGRSISEGFPNNVDSVVVMLNAEKAMRAAGGELDVYWGAYVGMPDEILVSGKLRDVLDDIESIRAEARKERGWIMDSVLMKKPVQSS